MLGVSSSLQDPAIFVTMHEALVQQNHWQGEIWNRRKSGEIYACMMSISAVRNARGELQHYVGVFSDISRIKAHQAELDRLAHYDPLTGVPNRRLLADRLDQAVRRARRNGKSLAVCYLDLDDFKPVNDRLGHARGDQLLMEITRRLLSALRAEDTLARLGGDEFVLLLTEMTQPDEWRTVLNRVLAHVQQPVELGEAQATVSASVGVTVFPNDDVDADTLLRHADQAMYRAKQAGRNRYQLFDLAQDREVQVQREQVARLSQALQQDELVLHYQPQVDLDTGEVVGAEALIRWQHPERGLLSPGAFLWQIEGTDLEVAVGEWVIHTALRQVRRWKEGGLLWRGQAAPSVSVNLSGHQLLRPGFKVWLESAIAQHPGVEPGDLELEILESAAIADMTTAAHVMSECRSLGVRFALDDFGTGYSSLAYFRTLPVNMIKIDQSFVRDMLQDADDHGIVQSVVYLAHAFHRPVIAEGVETLEHAAALLHLGCHLAQGYGIARPMPAERLPEWMDQWQQFRAWETLHQTIKNES
jgi:diguanylate cyclase (GGDEF)-like protein